MRENYGDLEELKKLGFTETMKIISIYDELMINPDLSKVEWNVTTILQ